MSEATRLSRSNNTAALIPEVSSSLSATTGDDHEELKANKCKQTFGIFTKFVVLRCLALFLYGLDMLTDLNAAYGDYKAGDDLFAYITVGLIFAPGLLYSFYMACEYCYMYAGDIACLKAPLSIIASPLLPVWVILRDVKQIIEGLVATVCPKKRPALIEKVPKPNRVYLLKFLEAFTEAAPQLLVRLYRVATRDPQPFSDLRSSEILQLSFSVLILSLKVVSTHQQNITTQQVLEGDLELHSKYRLPWFIQIIAIFWWMCFLVSRFEALALFTSSYQYWVLLVIAIHVILIFAFQTVVSHKDRLKRVFIYLFGAFVFIFSYVQFNLKSRFKIAVWFPYSVFAVILFIENSVMLTFWFYSQQSSISLILETINTTNYEKVDDLSELDATTAAYPTNYLMSDFTDSIAEDLSANSTMPRKAIVGAADLLRYWKSLLLIHYGIFGVGLVFMITTFCFTSCINNDDPEAKKNKVEQHEMEEILSNSQQS